MRTITLLTICCLIHLGFTQNAPATINHLLKFEFELADTLVNKLDDRSYEAQGKKVKVANNRLYLSHELDTLSRTIFSELFAEKGYPLTSNEVLKSHIKFGMDNTPLALSLKTAIKNLNKKGYAGDSYFAIQVKMGPGMVQILGKGIRPVVEVQLRQLGPDGKVVQRILEKYKAPEPILAYLTRDNPHLSGMSLESKKGLGAKQGEIVFDKTRREFMDILIEEFEPILDQGIRKAMGKL